MQDGSRSYSSAAKTLHWSVAILLLAVWPLGQLIALVRDEVKPLFYMWHESLGLAILALMLVRLVVRRLRPPPPPLAIPAWERRLASAVHVALYAVLLAQPVLGFLATNAYGFPLDWFWLVPIPSPIGEDQDLAPLLLAAHVVLGWTTLALIALHIAGVLKHRVVDHDRRQLERMT